MLAQRPFFCTYRQLYNHDYYTTRNMLQALDILCAGGVPKVLAFYPDFRHDRLSELLKFTEISIPEALVQQ